MKVPALNKNMSSVMKNYHVQSNVNTSVSPITKLNTDSGNKLVAIPQHK